MLVWLAYKEPTDKEFDYELVDLTESIEDCFSWDTSDDEQIVTEEVFDKAVLRWLNDHGACIYGERWCDASWVWTICDKPPLKFLLDKMRYSRVKSEEYAKEAYDTSVEIIGYYPDVMESMGDRHDTWRRTCKAKDEAPEADQTYA